ncbi:MAG: helix-turn-helix domain-containing protein [Tunicatimonas sp.]
MKAIETEAQYQGALKEIDKLLVSVGNDHSYDNPEFAKMDRLSDLVADYEDKHYPVELPPLVDVIKLKMYEMGLKQDDLAQLLEIPKSRISEYLRGKRDITLEVARKLHHRLQIDGDIILQ